MIIRLKSLEGRERAREEGAGRENCNQNEDLGDGGFELLEASI